MLKLKKKAKILTISGGKGGTGKTFLAVNLAVQMANRFRAAAPNANFGGNKVLIFDADFHLSNAHILLGEKLSPCLDRFLKEPTCLPEYIVNSQYGVDLISFGGDEKRINNIHEKINSKILDELAKLESLYDWIIVDTGAGLTDIILNQIEYADYTLLVTNPVATSIIDTYKVIKFISMDNNKQVINVCMNMVTGYEEGYQYFQKIDGILKQFNVKARLFFAGVVHADPPLFNKAIQKGIPASLFDNPNHIADSMNFIWDELLKKPALRKIESYFEKVFLS